MRVATQRSVHTSQAQIKHQRHKGYTMRYKTRVSNKLQKTNQKQRK